MFLDVDRYESFLPNKVNKYTFTIPISYIYNRSVNTNHEQDILLIFVTSYHKMCKSNFGITLTL